MCSPRLSTVNQNIVRLVKCSTNHHERTDESQSLLVTPILHYLMNTARRHIADERQILNEMEDVVMTGKGEMVLLIPQRFLRIAFFLCKSVRLQATEIDVTMKCFW